MTFQTENLAPTSVGMGDEPTRWAYTSTTDNLGIIFTPNYFLLVANILTEGDLIYVKESATVPFAVAEYLVRTITYNAENNPIGVLLELFVAPTSSVNYPVVESPAFDTTDTIYMGVGGAGTITEVRAILNGTNTTSAVTLTFSIGGVAIGDGTLSFGITDPVGTQLSQVLSTPNTVVAGQSLEVTSSGGGAAITATVTYTIS